MLFKVLYNERDGTSGRGVVIQDVNATAPICMSKIRDLKSYSKMVPHVKAVDIYYSEKFLNVYFYYKLLMWFYLIVW